MQTIKKQHGFTAIELILVVAVIAAIGFAGYYTVKAQHNHLVASAVSSTPSASTEKSMTTTYNGSDYSLQYPNSWVVNQPQGDDATSLKLVGTPIYFEPTKNSDSSGGAAVDVQEFVAGSDYLQTYNNDRDIDNLFPLDETPVTINGNTGYYSVEKAKYGTNLAYIIDHGNHAIEVTFNLSEAGEPTVNNSQYEAAFDAIAKSVTFH